MKTELPNEIWRMIIRWATFPGDVDPLNYSEIRIIGLFDPDSLENQDRFPWRKGFKHPVDSMTSLRTKLALVQVSRSFYDMSRKFLSENLYLNRTSVANLLVLQALYALRQPNSISTVANWTKRIYVRIDEDTPATNEWVDAVMAIVRQSTDLTGFFQIHDTHRMGRFWKHKFSAIISSVPACITHLEWSSLSSFMTPITFPTNAMVDLLRRAPHLIALRLSAGNVTLRLGNDIMLPELKYLDIDSPRHDLNWPKFASLTHVAFGGHMLKKTQLPGPSGGELPALAFLYFEKAGPSLYSKQFAEMFAATPNILTFVYSGSFPPLDSRDLWTLAENPSLQRVEIHFNDWYTPGDFGHTRHDMEVDFAGVREWLLPLADFHRFASLTDFKLAGFRHIRKRFGAQEPRLDEIANGALADLVARGVQASVEE